MPYGLTLPATLALSGIYIAVLITGHFIEAWLAKRRTKRDMGDVKT